MTSWEDQKRIEARLYFENLEREESAAPRPSDAYCWHHAGGIVCFYPAGHEGPHRSALEDIPEWI